MKKEERAYQPPCVLDAAAPAVPPPAPATGQAALAVKVEQHWRERRIGGGWLLRVGGQMGVCLGANSFTTFLRPQLYTSKLSSSLCTKPVLKMRKCA